jgi:hypothetical protein
LRLPIPFELPQVSLFTLSNQRHYRQLKWHFIRVLYYSEKKIYNYLYLPRSTPFILAPILVFCLLHPMADP